MLTFISKCAINGMIVIPFLAIFSDASWLGATVTAVLLSILSYWVGDLFILRRVSNLTATIADIGLTYVFLWMATAYMVWRLTQLELITVSLAVGVVEYFVVHKLMTAKIKQAT